VKFVNGSYFLSNIKHLSPDTSGSFLYFYLMKDTRFKRKLEDGKEYVFDTNRKKYVVLTAEEWVRQQVLYYMIHTMEYPAPVISVEKQIKVGTRNRRYDIVVYKESIPWMIIECKRETEKLTANVLSQLLSYNSTLVVSFLAITNGIEILCYDIKKEVWSNGLPLYETLTP